MKWSTLTVVACALAGLMVSAAWAKDAPADKEAVQGTWKMVSREVRGQSQPPGGPDDSSMVFKGDRFQILKAGRVMIEGTFKMDPTAKPRTIDMHVDKANDDAHTEGKTSLGIYELNGDDLRWCADEPGHETRPSEFSSQGERHMLVVLKREAKDAK